MKILFAKGNSAYGALRVYSDKFVAELRKRGHQVVVVDRQIEGQWENAINIIDDTYDMVWGYVMLPFKLKVLFEEAGKRTDNIKFIAFCGDHPIYTNYWLKKVKNYSKNMYLLVGDVNQRECIKKYYPWINVNSFELTIGDGIDEIVDYSKREMEVFFGGTYYNEMEELENIKGLTEIDQRIANKAIEKILAQEGLPLEIAVQEALNECNTKKSNEEFMEYLERFIPVDRYIRGYYRNMYIEAALLAGSKVYVYGNNWDESKFINEKKFFVIQGEQTMQKGHEHMANSKIVLNVMPWSRIGMHERILNALLAGAICVTNTNQIIEEEFGRNMGVRGFGLDDKEKIARDIRWLLDNEEEATRMAENGRKKALKDHNIACYFNMVWQAFEEIM